MAKKKRRIKEEPKETYEFTPTKFDEREFILKELFDTKIFFVVITLSLFSGILWALFYRMDILGGHSWVIGFLLVILMLAGLKKILAFFRVRVDMIQAKTMIGNYIMFFLLATGVAILLINAPFYMG
ncbi:MAG TPA: hypothetical protein VJX93_03675 [Candidatus Methanomethylophilaceae archaeon]|jgi:hypothetical protein|nr:hypothetical protein [Candidatus Methanomethylophilaceae archaeon]